MADILVTVEEKTQSVHQNEIMQCTLDESVKGGDQKESQQVEKITTVTTMFGENISKQDSPSESTQKENNDASFKEIGIATLHTPFADDTIRKEKQPSIYDGIEVLQNPDILIEPPFHETDGNTSNSSISEKISFTSENDSILGEVGSTGSIKLNETSPAEVEVASLSQYCPEMPSCFMDITEISEELFTTAKKLCGRQQEANEKKAFHCPDHFEIESKLSCKERYSTTDEELVNSVECKFLEIETLNNKNNFNMEGTSKPNNDDHLNPKESIEEEHREGLQSRGTMTDLLEDNEGDIKNKLTLAPPERLARISKEIENAENMANIVIDKLKGSFQGVTGSIINMTEDLGHAINDLIQDITTNVSPFDDNLPQQTYVLFDHLWHSLSQEVEQLKLLAEYLSKSVDNKFEN